jgi:hypothetical protein
VLLTVANPPTLRRNLEIESSVGIDWRTARVEF